MDFGAMFLARPPYSELVENAISAEELGFDYFFLNDCPTLFHDPWPLFGIVAEKTHRIRFGPLVTNPVNRDLPVTASMLATLNCVAPGRVVCGIGRGDAATRTMKVPSATVAEFEGAIVALRDLLQGREASLQERSVSIRWLEAQEVEVWGAGYGPRVLDVVARTCDGLVIQGADKQLIEWIGNQVLHEDNQLRIMVGAPAYICEEHEIPVVLDKLKWFGASVGNHIESLSRTLGNELPDDIRSMAGSSSSYDYSKKGDVRSGNRTVSRETSKRLSLVGPASHHVERLEELRSMGVDTFSIYFNHDRIEESMEVYGKEIMPRLRESQGSLGGESAKR